ncbi:MAG: hypothetical protein C4575_11575 [Desulforudis sp.]|jgi:HEAT repeat protein|nr:MAG: hypothetical protein C4575_11575 [Desulforudis sp.]
MQIKSLDDYARDLRIGSPSLRYHAVRQLVYYRGQGNVPEAILPAVDDSDPVLRREACLALSGLGKEALLILLKALNDPDERVVAAAARGLGQIGEAEAVPALLQALQSPSAEIRAAVGHALGAFPGRAENELLTRLQSPGDIREVIGLLSGLVEIRSSDVVMPLTALYVFATQQWVRDETWRFLTALLGVEADTDKLHEEVVLDVIRQCLECVPYKESEVDLTQIRVAVHGRDITGYCRLLFALALNLVTMMQIDRGVWTESPFAQLDRSGPDQLRQMLPVHIWTSIAVLNGLGGMGRDVEGRRVEASLSDYWLGALCLVSILQELDRELPSGSEPHPLTVLFDALALSGQVEPRALIRELAAFGNEAVPLLEAFIREFGSGGPAWWAAKALGQIGTPEAIEALISCLDADDTALSETAGYALGNLGDVALGRLVDYLRVPSKESVHGRETAAQALSMIRRPEALSLLFERSESPSSWVRFAAVRHLVNFGDPAAIPVLRRLYADEDQDVSFAAAEGLLEMAEIYGLELPELGEIKRMYDDDGEEKTGT